MANKNTAGKYVVSIKRQEDRLIRKIDQREKNGTNLENVDNTYNNYCRTEDGSKVWSF